MTVKELRKALSRLPNKLEVAFNSAEDPNFKCCYVRYINIGYNARSKEDVVILVDYKK